MPAAPIQGGPRGRIQDFVNGGGGGSFGAGQYTASEAAFAIMNGAFTTLTLLFALSFQAAPTAGKMTNVASERDKFSVFLIEHQCLKTGHLYPNCFLKVTSRYDGL